MIYSRVREKGQTVIKLAGRIDGAAVISAGSFIRSLDITYPGTVVFDIDGVENQGEMFYHVALLNTVKKMVEHAGGIFRIRTASRFMNRYLRMTGLKEHFTFEEPSECAGVEV